MIDALNRREKYRQMIHHHGLAEAFGVSQETLENMTMREISERAFELGGSLDFKVDSGAGVGLTLSARNTKETDE